MSSNNVIQQCHPTMPLSKNCQSSDSCPTFSKG